MSMPQPSVNGTNIPGDQNILATLARRCEAAEFQLEKQKQETDALKNDLGLTKLRLKGQETFRDLQISELEDNLAAKQAEQQRTQSEMNNVKARLQDYESLFSSTPGALQTDLRETRSWFEDQRTTFENLQTSTSSKVSQLENDLAAKQTELDDTNIHTSLLWNCLVADRTELGNTKASLQNHETTSSTTIRALQIDLQETRSRFKDQRTILRRLQASRISLLWNCLAANQNELDNTKASLQSHMKTSSSIQTDLTASKAQLQWCHQNQLEKKRKYTQAHDLLYASMVRELNKIIEKSKVREDKLVEEQADLHKKLKEANAMIAKCNHQFEQKEKNYQYEKSFMSEMLKGALEEHDLRRKELDEAKSSIFAYNRQSVEREKRLQAQESSHAPIDWDLEPKIQALETSNTSQAEELNQKIQASDTSNTSQAQELDQKTQALETSNTSQAGELDQKIQALETSNTSQAEEPTEKSRVQETAYSQERAHPACDVARARKYDRLIARMRPPSVQRRESAKIPSPHTIL